MRPDLSCRRDAPVARAPRACELGAGPCERSRAFGATCAHLYPPRFTYHRKRRSFLARHQQNITRGLVGFFLLVLIWGHVHHRRVRAELNRHKGELSSALDKHSGLERTLQEREGHVTIKSKEADHLRRTIERLQTEISSQTRRCAARGSRIGGRRGVEEVRGGASVEVHRQPVMSQGAQAEDRDVLSLLLANLSPSGLAGSWPVRARMRGANASLTPKRDTVPSISAQDRRPERTSHPRRARGQRHQA